MALLAPPCRPPVPEPPAAPTGTDRAPRLWREITLVAVFYGAYTLVRVLIPHDVPAAYAHAGQIMRLEHVLGLDVELDLNHGLMRLPGLARIANAFYATAHFVVTLSVLVWLYRRRPGDFRWLRTSLMIAPTGDRADRVLGLSPGAAEVPHRPRFRRPGDRAAHLRPVLLAGGGLAHEPVRRDALDARRLGAVVRRGGRDSFAPSIGTGGRALYPIVTILVIFSTANHYLLDAMAGAVIMVFALLVGFLLHRGGTAARPAEDHEVTNNPMILDGPDHSI